MLLKKYEEIYFVVKVYSTGGAGAETITNVGAVN
jgi:hypothetical protein